MRHRQLKPIFKEMLPALPGFVGQKRLLFKAPVGGLLCAIHFDPSGWSRDWFYVNHLVMPMCVPKDDIYLTFGTRVLRLGESDDWALSRPDLVSDLLRDIKAQSFPFFARAHSYRAAVDLIADYRANPHAEKAMAFLLARTGDVDGALALMDDYLPRLDLTSHWQKEIFDTSNILKNLLLKDPEAAHRQLLAWEDYTLKELKLDHYR